MRLPSIQPYALLASLALAGLTLGVFGVLYDYGPGSAIRQFHEALARDDAVELGRVVVPPHDPKIANQMIVFLRGLMQNGDVRIAATQRFDREVRAVVTYRDTDGNPFPVVFVVEKQDRQWQVNLEKTATIVRDLLSVGR